MTVTKLKLPYYIRLTIYFILFVYLFSLLIYSIIRHSLNCHILNGSG